MISNTVDVKNINTDIFQPSKTMLITLDTRPLPHQKTRTRKLITGKGGKAGILKFKPLRYLFPIVKPNLVITGQVR